MYSGDLVRVTGETTTLVTLAEFKNHVREDLDDSANNSYMTTLLSAATSWAEKFTGRTTINASYVYYLQNWEIPLRLPRPPISSITSITYYDPSGTQQTWSSTKYETDTYTGLVQPVYGETWPSVRIKPKSIAVTYVAGYGASMGNVPSEFWVAVMQLAAHWYEHRMAVSDELGEKVQLACKDILWPLRLKEFA